MLCASFFSFSSPVHAEQQRLSYDVVIAGGGAGGTSAAIAAARLGVRAALIEETDWLGGQMTAAAVSTMDDLSGNRTGIYGEFYENIRYHYFLKGKSVSTCYWDGNTMAFEPSVGRKILSEMVKAAEKKSKAGGKKGVLDIYYRSKVTAVRKSGNRISGVTADIGGKKVPIDCSVLIDATEYGDVIPLAGALYRAGNSLSPMISEKSRVQDITWTAVIKKYPGGIPAALRMTAPPPGYERYVPEFRKAVTKNGNSFRSYPLRMPVDFATHNGYRGLPDSSNPEDYDAASPEGWEAITKTGVNWTNDYPG
ncbi:MAG: FAD-dependent oxidoreductase, partial [Aminobacteriaceae bacterium]